LQTLRGELRPLFGRLWRACSAIPSSAIGRRSKYLISIMFFPKVRNLAGHREGTRRESGPAAPDSSSGVFARGSQGRPPTQVRRTGFMTASAGPDETPVVTAIVARAADFAVPEAERRGEELS